MLRDTDIAGTVADLPGSFGIFGSDKLAELSPDVTKRLAIEDLRLPVEGLRFALMAGRYNADEVSQKLTHGDPIAVVTSNPGTLRVIAEREDLNLRIAKVVSGQVEKYPALLGIEAAFDMVQTGNSARAQSLEIIRDDLADVRLYGAWAINMTQGV